MAITLQESLRGLFYAPFYVALARGAYAAEGVGVDFVSSPTPGQAAHGLLNGSVDVCWGGPMRVMETYQLVPGCDLVCFAEVVTRDPFFLVGRRPAPEFRLADLVGMRIATVSEVPTPWMCLQEDMRRAGIAPGSLDRMTGWTMAESSAALRRGEVDAVQVFEPYVSSLVANGTGHVWYAAATRGPTCYTTFYTRRRLLASRRPELHRMVRALYRTQQWIAGATGAQVGDAIAGFFPDVSDVILAASCERYAGLGIWGRDPVLPRGGYDRLRASLVSGGLVDSGVGFEVGVDNSIAEAVLAERPPTLA